MRPPRYDKILSAVARLDADPEAVQGLVQEVRSGLLKLAHQPRRTAKQAREATSLTRTVKALPVRLVAGGRKTLGDVLDDVRAATPPDLLDDLGPGNFYRTGPFLRLGQLPVSTFSDGIPDTRLADLFPVFGEAAEKRLPVSPPGRHSHTFWMHFSKSWWSALLYTKYSASTKATATGREACDVLG